MTLNEAVSSAKRVLDESDIRKVIAESNQAQRWFVETAADVGLTVDETTSTGKKDDRFCLCLLASKMAVCASW